MPQGAAAPSAPAHSIPEQLDQLADLRDRGVITQAEFDAKKAELLGRM
jgi:predicted Zn-dependent peptidase